MLLRRTRARRALARACLLFSCLAAGLGITACRDASERPPASRPLVRQIGDTVLVDNAGLPGRAGALEPVFSIGALDGDEHYIFGNVKALAVDARGRVYVSELRGAVRAYDNAGVFLGVVARRGQGPGEVEYVTGMDVTAAGLLVVRDVGNARFTVIEPEQGVVAEWRTAPDGRPSYGRDAVRVLDDGRFATGIRPFLPRDGTPLAYPRPVYAVRGAAGEPADTLFVPERYTVECPTPSTQQFQSGWNEDVRALYVPKPKWAITPRGELVVGCPATFAFDILRSDGSMLRVTRPWTEVEVSDAERRDVRQAITYNMRESGYFERWSWTGDELPAGKPAYHRLMVGDAGRVWVWPPEPSVAEPVPERVRGPGIPSSVWAEPDSGRFEVFDPTGRYLGSVARPPELHVAIDPSAADPIIRGDTVWAVTTDSLEVQHITRYMVRWLPPR